MQGQQVDPRQTGLIVVDHGSRHTETNLAFEKWVQAVSADWDWLQTEPAHMTLSEPSILAAVERCIEAGAKMLVVSPFFLLPGKHSLHDIPELVNSALAGRAVPFLITSSIGLHLSMGDVVAATVQGCISRATGLSTIGDACFTCAVAGRNGCRFQTPDDPCS